MKHLQNAETFSAVRLGNLLIRNAFQKMPAFNLERFFHINGHYLGICFRSNRNTLHPLDLVRIKQEFFLDGVIKNSHLFVSHHHQFLFLERMKP